MFQNIIKPDPKGVEDIFESIGSNQPAQYPGEQVGSLGLNDIIDNNFNQPRREKIENRGERRKGQRGQHQTTVRAEIAKNSEKRIH